MAGAYRHARDPVTESEAFFAHVRDASVRAGVAVGADAPPAAEPVRLGVAVGARFPDGELARDGGALVATFFGLTGPSGVLPDHYTERMVEARRDRSPGPGAFLDLFNHRALSHFWRAWAKYRLPVAVEADGGALRDPFSRALAALAGLGVAGERVPDEALLSMAGPLGRGVRSAGALRRILAGIYDLPVEVVELEGRWVEIAPEDRTRLGGGGAEPGAFASLGRDMVVGTSVWDVGSRFRVRLGPLDRERFGSFFSPDGPRAAIKDTIRRAVGGNVGFSLQLVLRREDVPRLRLGGDTADAGGLGQSTWLLAGAADRDRDEATINGG